MMNRLRATGRTRAIIAVLVMSTRTLGVIGAMVAVSPLLAHHDWLVNRTAQVRVTGTVTAFTWANPHVTIALEVRADGAIEKWILGGSSPKVMTDNGWDKSTLKPGDVITGFGYRFRNGSNVAQLQRIEMAGGKQLLVYPRLFD
jgi:hypothetical protein